MSGEKRLRELLSDGAPAELWTLHATDSTRVCDGAHATEAGCAAVLEAEILYRPRAEAEAVAAFCVKARRLWPRPRRRR